MSYDAVVVGAGPNGLSAAITLARAGRSVLVLEAAPRPGGAVITEELTLPGFRHDVFSSVYPAGAASPVFSSWPLAEHGLEWVHPEAAMAHPLPDGRAAVLYRDVDRTAEALDRVRPGDGRAWAELVRPYVQRFGAVRSLMLGAFPPLPGLAKLLLRFGVQGTLEFGRLVLMPAQALAEELFAGDEAAAWLYGSALHGDVPPDEAGSAIAGLYLNLMGHAVGWPSPRGGADGLSGALAGYLRALGGELRTSSPVERVLTSGGRATGVVVAGGERVAGGVVVCDLGVRGLLAVAGEALPEGYRRRLVRYRPGPPTVKLDWALSGPIPWAAEEARGAGTVHVGGTAEELRRFVLQLRAGVAPEQPFLLSGQQTVADPSRAPAGQHTAWAYTHVPPDLDWTAEGERMVERMQAQMERFAPGFGDLVLARHVLSPGDMQARNPNLIAGDVGGGSYTLDQVIFRPVPSLVPYRTPVAGLYLGSASTFPGGAVHGVPGWAAARVALAEQRLRRLVPGGR